MTQESNQKLVAIYTIPPIIYGTEHWEAVVAENQRLGANREEAELFVNAMLCDQDSLPQKKSGKMQFIGTFPINEDGSVTITGQKIR